jgi:hypothetical protein
MDLCRIVKLDKSRSLSHEIRSIQSFSEITSPFVVVGPFEFSSASYRYAAALDRNLPSIDFSLPHDFFVTWSVLIADMSEKKPLLVDGWGGRSLLLLGEVVEHLFEAFDRFGLKLNSVAPDSCKNLIFDFKIPHGMKAQTALGTALCLVQFLDGLLFVRGLEIAVASVTMPKESNHLPRDFLGLFQRILMEPHDDCN